ncbi:transporter substrate-binding domain-containing protein [Flavobacteriaceae bacterium]|nr:transporter substrate-binding domain-containing protein [Flavobacteriaceae bacterium]
MRLSFLFMFMVLTSCGTDLKKQNESSEKDVLVVEQLKVRDMDQILSSGELRVVIKNAPTSYFIYRGQPMGYEYELVSKISKYFDLDLKFEVVDDIDTATELIEKGHADLLAYNLTVTKSRKEKLDFTEPIYEIHQVLIQKKPQDWRKNPWHVSEKKLIRKTTELAGEEVFVVHNSAHKSRLNSLSDEIGADIIVNEAPRHFTAEQLLDWVRLDSIQYVAVDSNVGKLYTQIYPDLDAETALSFEQNIAWGVSKGAQKWLDTLNAGINAIRLKPDLNIIYNRYYGNNRVIRNQVKNFSIEDHKNILSQYDELLKEASDTLGWDWRYLAAMIQTESNFDPKRKSWAGAHGLMQLMPNTYKSYGVQNPFNAEQNVNAGVAHILWLQDYWSSYFQDDSIDLTPFVLASYNAGHGHIKDAMKLTELNDDDPKNWVAVEENLIKLSLPKYYKKPEIVYGYCRGTEPVDYVKKINRTYQRYYELIEE